MMRASWHLISRHHTSSVATYRCLRNLVGVQSSGLQKCVPTLGDGLARTLMDLTPVLNPGHELYISCMLLERHSLGNFCVAPFVQAAFVAQLPTVIVQLIVTSIEELKIRGCSGGEVGFNGEKCDAFYGGTDLRESQAGEKAARCAQSTRV